MMQLDWHELSMSQIERLTARPTGELVEVNTLETVCPSAAAAATKEEAQTPVHPEDMARQVTSEVFPHRQGWGSSNGWG